MIVGYHVQVGSRPLLSQVIYVHQLAPMVAAACLLVSLRSSRRRISMPARPSS